MQKFKSENTPSAAARKIVERIFPDCFEVPFEEVQNHAPQQTNQLALEENQTKKPEAKKSSKNQSKTYENSQLGFEI